MNEIAECNDRLKIIIFNKVYTGFLIWLDKYPPLEKVIKKRTRQAGSKLSLICLLPQA